MSDDEALPPSRHHVVPKMSRGIVRKDTFDFIKENPRMFAPMKPLPGPLNAKPVDRLPDAGFAEINVTEAKTVPYTMKFISLNGGRTWYETYKVHVEVRQFNYDMQVFYMPILHLSDAHPVYGKLYDSSDKAIKSILYKKVNAKELVPDVEQQPHTPEQSD